MFNVIENLYDILRCPQQATISLAYKLKNLEVKTAYHKNHLTFYDQIQKLQCHPKGIRLHSSILSMKVNRIIHRANKAILRDRIKAARITKEYRVDETTNRIINLPDLSYFE